MKPVYQLFAVLMLLGAPAFSQQSAGVLRHEADSTGTTRIVYSNGLEVHSFRLPDGMVVNDLETDDGNAWFCGKRGGNGVVGTFNIARVFDGSEAVHYALFTVPMMMPNIYPCWLEQLELANCDGTTVMAMTGSIQTVENPHPYPAVMAVTFDGLTDMWNCCYRFCKDHGKVYTDIAVTPDAVVTTMAGEQSRMEFKKSACFPYYPMTDGQADDEVTFSTSQIGIDYLPEISKL